MNRVTVLLAQFSLLLLAAHHLRYANAGMVAFCAGVMALAATRRAMARWVVVGVLAHAAWIWAIHAQDLVLVRLQAGEPHLRLAAIMSGVVAVTLLSGVLAALRGGAYWNRDENKGPFQATLFLLTVSLLFLARSKVSFPILLLDRFLPGWGGVEVFVLGVYAAWIGTLMFEPKGARKVRPRIWAGFSAVFFAQLALGLAGVEKLLMTGTLHLPDPALIVGGPLFRGEGVFMLVLFGATVLLAGPAWCSHLCYIGAWDDQCSRLGGKGPRREVPGRWHWLRGVNLALVVLAALGLRMVGASGAQAVVWAAGFGLAGVGVMIFLSRRLGIMAHCTTWCPMGIVAGLLGRLHPFRIRLGKSCTGCGTCAKVCRYGALGEQAYDSGRPGLTCTLCGDCVSVCPKRTAGYSFFGLGQERARLVFLGLTIPLHAVFLGVARI